MLVRQEVGDGVDVLAVAGAIAQPDALRLAAAVETASQQSRGVLVDLGDVTALAADAADTLCRLADRDARWPHAALCLCGAPPAVAQALRGAVVHPTRSDALAHLGDLGAHHGARGRRVVTIDHSVHGPAQARRAVAECAAALGLAEQQGEDLLLVVSEMVTNAVRHGAPPVELEVAADDDTVLVAVTDGSPRRPHPRPADTEAEGGRGMTLVDLLCAAHGVRPQPPGKAVWAAVRRRPEGAGS